MGVIKRQGIKRSIVNYVGVGIGALSTLFIYPLDTEAYGLMRFVIDTAFFLFPFASLGTVMLVIRYFPIFKDPEKAHNGFFSFILLLATTAVLLFLLFGSFLKEPLLNALGVLDFDTLLIGQYLSSILIISILLVYLKIFTHHAINFQRIVVPEIYNNLLLKFTLPTLTLLSFWGLITLDQIPLWLYLTFFLITLLLLSYLRYLKVLNFKVDLSFVKPKLFKEMMSYSLFGILGNFGSILAFRIDSIMVASMISLSSNGVYNIAVFIGNAIEIPLRSLRIISAPLISAAWEKQDYEEIAMIYKKSSLILFIVGLYFFLVIWLSVDDLFSLTPKFEEVIAGKYVILFLGLAKVVDMLAGVNNELIAYSKFYRFNLVAILLLGIFNILTNYTFIPLYGLTGAAMATALSLVLFNVVKFLYIWAKFKIQPFTLNTFYVLLIACIAYLAGYFTPGIGFSIIDLVVRSLVISAVFVGPILYFRLSEDLNDLLENLLKKLKLKK